MTVKINIENAFHIWKSSSWIQFTRSWQIISMFFFFFKYNNLFCIKHKKMKMEKIWEILYNQQQRSEVRLWLKQMEVGDEIIWNFLMMITSLCDCDLFKKNDNFSWELNFTIYISYRHRLKLQFSRWMLNQLDLSSSCALLFSSLCFVHPQNVQEKSSFYRHKYFAVFCLFSNCFLYLIFLTQNSLLISIYATSYGICLSFSDQLVFFFIFLLYVFLTFYYSSPAVIRSSSKAIRMRVQTLKNFSPTFFDLLSHHVHIALNSERTCLLSRKHRRHHRQKSPVLLEKKRNKH